MKALVERKPVMFGVVSAIAVFVLYLLVSMGLRGLVTPLIGSTSGFLIGSILRIVFTVPTIILLGYIIKDNGFKFTFSTKGFAKSMFAGIPILIYVLTLVIPLFDISKMNTDFISTIPANIFQQITVGVFEESLFRGLLMTALIAKFCDKAKGRFLTVFICGLLFGLLHFFNDSTISIGLVTVGIAFSVVYLYSKNLFGCIILHALFDIASSLNSGLIAEVGNKAMFQSMQIISAIILLAMPLLAIPWIIKAKPFNDGFQQVRK